MNYELRFPYDEEYGSGEFLLWEFPLAFWIIAMPTFLSYFNQGLLNYNEQIISRVEDYFTPFDQEILRHFGLSVNDFIEIYNFIDKLPNQFLMKNINKKEGQKTWKEFGTEMMEKD